jgi:hypothetical protein
LKPLAESELLSFGDGLHIGSHKHEIMIYQRRFMFRQLGLRTPKRLLLWVV